MTLTLATAFCTPLPPYRFESPSRSSSASCAPVDAPEGTAARPQAPPVRRTSTSMVGLPRESRISRALISAIAVLDAIGFNLDATEEQDPQTGESGCAHLSRSVEYLIKSMRCG